MSEVGCDDLCVCVEVICGSRVIVLIVSASRRMGLSG